MDKQLLTTRAAAQLLGVGTTSIKRWADSGVLRCVRTPGGHRRFPRGAVEALLVPRNAENDQRPQSSLTATVLDRLLGHTTGDELLAFLKERRAEAGTWWRVAEEIADVLVTIGDRWRRGELSIVSEHIASERLARVLARAAEGIPLPADAPVALLLVAEGEEHTLGLSLLELCLREAGFVTRWTGRRTPIELVSAHLAQSDVELVAVSASVSSDDRAALAGQAMQLSAACQRHGVDLVLGGRGAWPEILAHGDRVYSFEHLNEVLAARSKGASSREQGS